MRISDWSSDVCSSDLVWDQAVRHWRTLHTDPGAAFDHIVEIDARQVAPQVTWGTSPEMVLSVDARVPDPDKEKDDVRRGGMERALQYMGLKPNTPLVDIKLDRRSEERRVGKGGVSTCNTRGSPYH